jgi:hypothetical protein
MNGVSARAAVIVGVRSTAEIELKTPIKRSTMLAGSGTLLESFNPVPVPDADWSKCALHRA